MYATSNTKMKYAGLGSIPVPAAAFDPSGGGTATLNAPLGGKFCEDGQVWTVAGG